MNIARNRFSQIAKMAIFAAVATVICSCSSSLYSATSYADDDMYSTHNQSAISEKKAIKAEAAARLQEQRKAQWANVLGMENQQETILVNNEEYQTPYGEKLMALSATKYQKPSSYYNLSYDEATLNELSQYDPNDYNVMVSSRGTVSLEPKYLSSMYGTWSSPYYSSVWGYPSYYYRPSRYYWDYYYSPYYSHYYSPYWGGYYYDNIWYSPMPSRPSYRPQRKPNIVRQANPYVSPSSRGTLSRNHDGSTVGRSSSSNSNNTYRREATRSSSWPSNNSFSSPTRVPSSSSSPSISTAPARVNSFGR